MDTRIGDKKGDLPRGSIGSVANPSMDLIVASASSSAVAAAGYWLLRCQVPHFSWELLQKLPWDRSLPYRLVNFDFALLFPRISDVTEE